VTETPLLDELDQLGDAGFVLLGACEQIVDQARHELRIREKRARRALLDRRVADFFAANPGARPTRAYEAIKGYAKADVVESVRRLRPAVPEGQNQTGSEAA
jgi:hypothetical protein